MRQTMQQNEAIAGDSRCENTAKNCQENVSRQRTENVRRVSQACAFSLKKRRKKKTGKKNRKKNKKKKLELQ